MNSNLLKINGIRVEKDLDQDLPDIMGSEDQLQQVFMNLISNAVEAMDSSEEDVLRVETEHSLKNDSIVARVRDTGMGISRENRAELFEPFFTTKKRGKGVGLGLSVGYGIIEEGSVKKKEIQQFKQYLNLMETETRRVGGLDSNLLSFARQSKMNRCAAT